MVKELMCPLCGKPLAETPDDEYYCKNKICFMRDYLYPSELIELMLAGKKARAALNKISCIKESVEGCCAEIQQNCLPFLFSIDRDMKVKIDKEVSAIDKYMSDIDTITKQEV